MEKEQRTRATSSGPSGHLPQRGKAITVVEYVRDAEGREVRVDELGAEQYETFRQWLGCSWLNGIFRGRAVFGDEGGCHG